MEAIDLNYSAKKLCSRIGRNLKNEMLMCEDMYQSKEVSKEEC